MCEVENIFNPEVVNVGIVSTESQEKKRMPDELLKAQGTFHFKNKRVPLDKCHLNLVPLRGCLSVSLSRIHLDA